MPGGGMPGGACFALGRRALAGVAGLQRPPCARRLRDAWRRGGLEALASEPGVGAPCTWQTILQSGNFGWLIDVRAAMLGAGGGFRAKHPGLEPSLKAQLRAALLPGEGTGSGALPGELLAVPIGPDTSVGVLQRAVEAEQVHPVASTSELLPRLTDPFRCFALEHTAMPGRPLTFLYSRLLPFPGDFGNSLVRIMPNPCSPEPPLRCASAARSVVFYSVSAAEPGLRGIGLAGLLIKRAAGTLSMSHGPGLQSFATLSPVHGFRDWLAKHCRTLPSRIRVLVGVPSGFSRGATGEEVGEDELEQYLAALEEHRSSVLGLCARYLLRAREDPVFLFHTRNGAVPWDLQWSANRSASGLRDSLGIMATYRYFPEPAYRDGGPTGTVTPMEACAIGSVRALRGGRPGPCQFM